MGFGESEGCAGSTPASANWMQVVPTQPPAVTPPTVSLYSLLNVPLRLPLNENR